MREDPETLSPSAAALLTGKVGSSASGNLGLIHKRKAKMRLVLKTLLLSAALLLTVSPLHAQAPDLDLTAIEATAPTPANQLPVAATFYSAQNLDLPPTPGNFYSLPAWSVGDGIYLLDDVGSGVQPMDEVPQMPGGWETNGGGGSGGSNVPAIWIPPSPIRATDYATNNVFYLTISNIGSLTYVSLSNTLSNISYEVLTNSNISTTNWGFYTNVLATSNVTPLQPVDLSTNTVFFWAKMIGSTCPNQSALPDWESMLLYNSLCVPSSGGYITNGLAAYWRMNDRGGNVALDSSTNGINLPLISSPSWGPDWLTLDGSTQYGDAGSNILNCLDTNDVTICAWINYSGSSQEGLVVKGYWLATNDLGGWAFTILNGQLTWQVEGGDQYVDSGPGILPLNQWAFVTFTWSNSTRVATFYINGLLNSAPGGSGNNDHPEVASGIGHLEVGDYSNPGYAAANLFAGSMHDVALYNRVLSAEEVTSNFFATEPSTNVPVPDELYYKMTEGVTNYDATPPEYLADSSTQVGTNGEVFGNPDVEWTTNVASIPNTAIHFHGTESIDNYIDTRNSNLFNFTTNLFTLNLWVEPTSSANHYFMQNQDVTGTNGWFLMCDENYRVKFGTVTNGVTKAILTPEAGAQNFHWNMVTVVRTSLTNAIIYINGLQVVSGSVTSPSSSASTLKLGIDPTGTNLYDGNIWLTQIWGEPLSGVDVANLHFAQTNGNPSP